MTLHTRHRAPWGWVPERVHPPGGYQGNAKAQLNLGGNRFLLHFNFSLNSPLSVVEQDDCQGQSSSRSANRTPIGDTKFSKPFPDTGKCQRNGSELTQERLGSSHRSQGL